ncbi:MAG: hypothetical protein IJS74_01335 [Clostridia bacterium]|nr:hypothetical protein [Clostridia bacterium]
MMFKVKVDKKKTKRPLKVSEIEDLSMCVFIVKRSMEDKLKASIMENDGKILSITYGTGISRSSIFNSLRVGSDDVVVFFVTIRVEDVRKFMRTISKEFELAVPGNGKGFVLDVDGYLGAKALFVE